jgi:hypothetical protein
MDYRILLYVLLALAIGAAGSNLAAVAGWLPYSMKPFEIWTLRLTLIMSLVILLAHSSFFRSWTAAIVIPGILIAVAGALFKIMHWPWANQMLLMGPALLVIGYTLRFALRRPIGRQAVMRWVFVVSYCGLAVGQIFHLLDPRLRFLLVLPQLLLVVTAVDLLLTRDRKRDISLPPFEEMDQEQ